MAVDQKTFLKTLVPDIQAAPQDVSLPILQDLLEQGYDSVKWNTSSGATDMPCIVKGGDVSPLDQFIAGLAHDAPIYEKTHVGCKCTVTVTGPGLPDVEVGAFGVIGEHPAVEKPEEVKPVEVPVEVPKTEPAKAKTKPAAKPAVKPVEKPKTPAKPAPKPAPKPVPKPAGGRAARSARAAR